MADTSLKIRNLNDAPTIFADVFLVSGDPEAGIYSVYFCQKEIQVPSEMQDVGSSELSGSNEARCVARVVFSEKGLEALAEGLQGNRAFTAEIRRKGRESRK